MLQCWKGCNYNQANMKILVLGESHYGGEKKTDLEPDKTKGVVKRYLDFKNGLITRPPDEDFRWTAFFTKIAYSFGYTSDASRISEFYSKIIFANYIDKYCGLRDKNTANELMKVNNYRIHCNDELFNLINENGIDIIVCFSKLAYNNMPSLAINTIEAEHEVNINESGRADRVRFCNYLRDTEHNYCNTKLKKDLKVYCFNHPASGYSPSRVREYLKSEGINLR